MLAADSWMCNDGPDSDVVMSCRARLARNIAGFPFVGRASSAQRKEIVNLSRQVLLGSDLAPGMIWVDLGHAPDRDRRVLVERHLISANLASAEHERAVAISDDETLSIMVNEEDHLRIQSLAAGLRLATVFERVNQTDDRIESNIDFEFSRRWGYLTACPTNVGTGIRFSVMMHLPGLRLTQEVNKVRRAAKDLHLAVRGFYGEGSESAGDFYQVSNQVTLGLPEEEILAEFQDAIVPRIIEYERHARATLAQRRAIWLDDRLHRAVGTLRSARLLSIEEAMKLLSRVRLGVHLGRLEGISAETVNRLLLQIQPAHLQLNVEKEPDADERKRLRAEIVRTALA